MLKIYLVETNEDLEISKALLVEYVDSLDFDLVFLNFEEELRNLPGGYAAPEGCLLLAKYQDQPIGCVALRKLSDGICEMKRLYIKTNFQRKGIGAALCKALIEQSKEIGYKYLRLATALEPAKRLYESLGFGEI